MEIPDLKPSYADLERQVRALDEESRRRHKVEQILRRQNAYLSALHDTTLGLINRREKEELLEAILDRAAVLTGTKNGFFYLLEDGDDQLQMRVGMGFFSSQLGLRVYPGEGLGGKVWETGEPLVVNKYHEWDGRLPGKALDRLRTVAGIPLKSENRLLGVLGLASMEGEREFDREGIEILGRFAELATIALDNVRLYEGLRHELEERETTEAKLRESETRVRNLLESSPDPVVVYRMDGTAAYVNPAFEETFGWSREELLGRKIDFVPEEEWPATRREIDRMLSGQTISLFETRRKNKAGDILDVQLTSTLYRDHHGNQAGNIVTLRDISEKKRAERELGKYHEQLEVIVEERTSELERSNRQLAQEVEERSRAEEALRKREAELKAQSLHLEEVNTALKVLLKQREGDRREVEENVLSNVRELVHPYLARMKKGRLHPDTATMMDIVETNLDNIVSPFISRLSSKHFKLTPMEIKVANLIKTGKTSQEIADMLYVSKNTIIFHRYNIRRKLGLLNTKTNLATHLLSFDE